MLPGAKAKFLEKEQEKQKRLAQLEERRKFHSKIVKIIEEDDLDSLKEFVPGKMPVDELIEEFHF